MDEFKTELTQLMNKHGWDTITNIPDFILAENVVEYLLNLEKTLKDTIAWHDWKTLSERTNM